MTKFFGPLDKGACVYFLIISMIFFVTLIILTVTEVFHIIKNFKNMSFRTLTAGIILLFNAFLAYFVNRLLYSMCNKSLA